MRRVRPLTLYEFNIITRDFERHVCAAECAPQYVNDDSFGTRWRCRSDDHDCYGYDKRKSAKLRGVCDLEREIHELQKLLITMRGPDTAEEKECETSNSAQPNSTSC
jgi:hypothetical protein